MGRPLRIEYPGAYYHITSRGNERKSIFRTKRDYERFLGYLESATERYGARIHCFCLLSNHYHVLLETPRGNLHRILHHLNTSYTNYFNVKNGRVGHLFQGRYRAILVDRDSYALELSRYIHLNPVRAQLVEGPSDYPWSSYWVYVGKAKGWDWLQTGFILEQLSSEEGEAQRKYRRYVEEGIGKDVVDPLEKVIGSTVLGSEEFVKWVREKWAKKMSADREVPALRKLSWWPDLYSIRKESERVWGKGTLTSRKMALYLSHRHSGLCLAEIGKFFGGISPSGVTQNSRRVEAELEENTDLCKEIKKLEEMLRQ